MKVYGVVLPAPGNWKCRQVRAVVAARSRAAAGRAFGVSDYFMAGWSSTTGNEEEIAVALAEPGVVFHRPIDRRGDWKRRS